MKPPGFRAAPPPPPPYGPFDPSLAPEQQFDALRAAWGARLAKRGTPGGALAIVLDGKLRFAAGVGTRDSARDEPITATTRFRTASISKMVIAATILSLVEHDGLELERPLTHYLPSFQRGPGFDASLVTLEMLLTHTGGIPDSTYCPDGASLRTTIDRHAGDPYWVTPGRLYDYSNADYALLAAVIEEQLKRPFEEVVTERVLRPAGMSTASYVANETDLALAYGHVGHEVVWTHPTDCEASRAAGGVIASVTDFAHFTEVLLAGGGAVLSPASVAAMGKGKALLQSAPLEKYGYGLIEGEHGGLRTLEHSGFSAVEKARSTDPEKVIAAMGGQTFTAPSGFTLAMDATNHHLHKPVFIGEIRPDGQFNVVWKTKAPVRAQPWSPYVAGNEKKQKL